VSVLLWRSGGGMSRRGRSASFRFGLHTPTPPCCAFRWDKSNQPSRHPGLSLQFVMALHATVCMCVAVVVCVCARGRPACVHLRSCLHSRRNAELPSVRALEARYRVDHLVEAAEFALRGYTTDATRAAFPAPACVLPVDALPSMRALHDGVVGLLQRRNPACAPPQAQDKRIEFPLALLHPELHTELGCEVVKELRDRCGRAGLLWPPLSVLYVL
jgi:hypothetical protein